jgi:hypothetical protein
MNEHDYFEKIGKKNIEIKEAEDSLRKAFLKSDIKEEEGNELLIDIFQNVKDFINMTDWDYISTAYLFSFLTIRYTKTTPKYHDYKSKTRITFNC